MKVIDGQGKKSLTIFRRNNYNHIVFTGLRNG